MHNDLDTLISKCRNEKSKKYILEAISCCNEGAYRAAIISTWVSILFDFIYKFHELALSGDKQAEKLDNEHSSILAARDYDRIKKSQDFERNILTEAQNLELFTDLEKEDLIRIQTDRNRCAHPTMINLDEIFEPSREQAYAHIVNAINIVLSQLPAQGKIAHERVMKDIDSQYFPKDIEAAREILKNGPINKGRKSLVRGIILVLLKDIINEKKRDRDILNKYFNVLCVIREMNQLYYDDTLRTELDKLLEKIDESEALTYLFALLSIPCLWELINNGNKLKIQAFITADINIFGAENILKVRSINSDLQGYVENAVILAGGYTLESVISYNKYLDNEIIVEFKEEIIDLFLDSTSFTTAIQRQESIYDYLRILNEDELIEFITRYKNNKQCSNNYYSSELEDFILSLDLGKQENIKLALEE
ncbi:hypothetical protein [Providencia rettgeri]|uniref:hypothetical protein n=1 Tax=Providencia rettgeri TaxID=587 RepID=UPI003524A113